MSRLSGKVALITGAGSGIGFATARLFSAEGAKVVATDISEDSLARATEDLASMSGEVLTLRLDVSSPESWQHVVAHVTNELSTIDVLVNNAGVALDRGILDT